MNNTLHAALDHERWVIVNVVDTDDDARLWWSNDDGWTTDLETASFFDSDEITRLDLPLEGAWLPVRRAIGHVHAVL